MEGKNTEYISVSELSKQVSKSPQWIYKLIKNKPEFFKYVKQVDNVTMVHKSAVWQYFGIGIDEQIKQDSEPDIQDVNSVESVTAFLMSELKARDKEIERLTEAVLHGQELVARLSAKVTLLEDKLFSQAASTEPAKEQTPEPSSSDGAETDSQRESKAESDIAEHPENAQKEKSSSSYGLDIQQSKRPSSIQPHTAPKRKRPEYLSSKRQKSVYEAYRPTERGFRGFMRKVFGF